MIAIGFIVVCNKRTGAEGARLSFVDTALQKSNY
jgi:hypothetical protein